MDILDMGAATSPLRQILQLLQAGGSTGVTGNVAELAAHLGLMPRHQHSVGMLAELEVVLSDKQQQSGPQLVSDYVLPR